MTTAELPQLDFLFMRHGHSVDNHMGRLPHPEKCEGLSEIGRRQVLEAIEALRQHHEWQEVIFSSPLNRAYTTASMIGNALGVPVEIVPEVREQDLGAWAGQPWKTVEGLFASRMDPPQGEKYEDFYRRIQTGLTQIAAIPSRKLVVSHGGVWHGIKALHGDFGTDWPPNASIGRVIMQDNQLRLQPLFIPTDHPPAPPSALSAG